MSSKNASQDRAARFISSAVDWRHVLTGVVVGFPVMIVSAIGFQRVTEYAIAEVQRRLDVQRTTTREENAKEEARSQREIDDIKQDVRDLRSRIDQMQQQRNGGR